MTIFVLSVTHFRNIKLSCHAITPGHLKTTAETISEPDAEIDQEVCTH